MSTRSRIGKENADGSVTSIYCHHDGYPEHNGNILANYYQKDDEVKALIALGDISSLDITTDGTTAYARDRGEDINQAEDKDVPTFFNGDIEEWGYLYTQEGEWLIKKGYGKEDPVTIANFKATHNV